MLRSFLLQTEGSNGGSVDQASGILTCPFGSGSLVEDGLEQR